MTRDLRFAIRSLVRSPGFTVAAVATLALGIGANSAIFSVLYAVLLRSLPFGDPDHLVRLYLHPEGRVETVIEASRPDFNDYRRHLDRFEDLAAFATSSGGFVVHHDGEAERIEGKIVSGSFFSVLGVSPIRGRLITDDDDVPGAAPVAVLSERLWRRRFGADEDLLGQSLRIEGVSYTIVGITPAGFDYPRGSLIWLPVAAAIPPPLLETRQVRFLNLVGRLREGVSLEQGREEMTALLERITNAGAPEGGRVEGSLAPFEEDLLGDTRRRLRLFTGAALLVLLIACANVANLQIVRAVAHRQEYAVRRALGASLGGLLRISLTESLLIALAGGALGLGLARWGLAQLGELALFRAGTIRIDLPVLLFTLTLSVSTVLVFGLVPAVYGVRQRLAAVLRQGESRTATSGGLGRRLLDGFVVLQILIAMVLLLAAGVLLHSFVRLGNVDPGFDREHVLTMSVPLESAKYAEPAAARQLWERLVERVATLPGVEAAAGVLLRPLHGPFGYDSYFTIEGRPADEQRRYPLLNYEAVTADYFRTLGIPLLDGRVFGPEDREESAGVVVVSDAVARRFWPAGSPVGQRLKWGGPDSEAPWLTVVGVVGQARYRDLGTVSLDVYVPFRQSRWTLRHLAVRSALAPAALAAAVGGELAALDPELRPLDVATTAQLASSAIAGPRFNTLLVSLFAALALLLGAVGIYGVMAYTTALRTSELGIRTALGATPRELLALALAGTLRLALAGVALGLLLGIAFARLLSGFLFEVSAADLLTFAVVPILLLAVALLAGLVPALRASRIEPEQALRWE